MVKLCFSFCCCKLFNVVLILFVVVMDSVIFVNGHRPFCCGVSVFLDGFFLFGNNGINIKDLLFNLLLNNDVRWGCCMSIVFNVWCICWVGKGFLKFSCVMELYLLVVLFSCVWNNKFCCKGRIGNIWFKEL